MTQFENRSLRCEEYSPPRRGGVDATSIKCREASFLRSGRGGQTGESKYCAELTTITASRSRFAPVCAGKRSLRGFLIDRAATPLPQRRGIFLATKTLPFLDSACDAI